MKKLLLILAICSIVSCKKKESDANASRSIVIYAGNGTQGYSGDGGPATAAALNMPFGIAMDGNGNLYIADQQAGRVRTINVGGIISRIAGGGYFWDDNGGMATDARLSIPYDVAVDDNGNVYIADQFNDRICKVDGSGAISTIAGAFNLYGFTGDGGPATNASLAAPSAIAADHKGNIFISDVHNSRIRKISAAGIISTIAGNGERQYSGDGGAATNASIYYPAGIAVDKDDNIYFADMGNNCVRKITTSGIITTVAGNGKAGYSGDNGAATSAQLSGPADVAVDNNGNLFIVDLDRIRKVTSDGRITTILKSGISVPAIVDDSVTRAYFFTPAGVTLDGHGNIYISTSSYIWKIHE